jgi:hypothetical protein
MRSRCTAYRFASSGVFQCRFWASNLHDRYYWRPLRLDEEAPFLPHGQAMDSNNQERRGESNGVRH